MSGKWRVAAVVTIAVLLAAGATWYVRSAARDRGSAPAAYEAVSLAPGPRLLAVTDRHLTSVDAADPTGPRHVSAVECVRVYAAAGTGICIHPDTAWSYQVLVLDAQLRQRAAFAVPGLPNRARVSPSGRLVAWTTFVGGDSYATGGFSTRTGIYDSRTGSRIMSLEEFAITRAGRPYRAVDVNFWGVTFAADDNLFYASMSTDATRYLVRGDLAARTVTTVTDNVECPSLSPDGTRIAFKRAVDGDPGKGWRLSVLDLATLRVTPLAELTSVDDQPAWLGGGEVAYTLRQADGRADVWAVPADGTGAPRLLIPQAESPSPVT